MEARKTAMQRGPSRATATFEEAFPGLEDVILEYRAARPGGAVSGERPLPTLQINLRKRGPPLHCLGGFDVTGIVREMLAAGETEREGRIACSGREAESDKAWDQCEVQVGLRLQDDARAQGPRISGSERRWSCQL